MSNRVYNFAAGPATIAVPVLEKAQQELQTLYEQWEAAEAALSQEDD